MRERLSESECVYVCECLHVYVKNLYYFTIFSIDCCGLGFIFFFKCPTYVLPEFDPDDPLAGVLSGSDDISESDRPKSATKNSVPASKSQPRAAVNDVIGNKNSPPGMFFTIAVLIALKTVKTIG